jgi:hypothetical protein
MIRQHRIEAFCDWLDTIPPDPPFHAHPGFRFFRDLTQLEIDAAASEMDRRAASNHAEASRLEACVAEHTQGPVSVYGSEKHRQVALADEVASAAISAAWKGLTHTLGRRPTQAEHLEAALALLRAAEPLIQERLDGGEAA